MSRHLFIVVVATPDVLDALQRSHADDKPLSPILADVACQSRIAYLAVVFDGWSDTAEELARFAIPRWQSALSLLTSHTYTCTRFHPYDLQGLDEEPLRTGSPPEHVLNSYAIRTLSIALHTAANFSVSTGLDCLVTHTSLGVSSGDEDYRRLSR